MRVSAQDLARFFRCLHAMVGAGVPVHVALESLARGDASPLGQAVDRVVRRVESGVYLSRALELEPALFPPLTYRLLRVGERSGSLHVCLEQLADYLERAVALRQQAQAAFLYPAMLALLTMLMVSVLGWVVFPRQLELVGSLGGHMPWLSQVLLRGVQLISAGLPVLILLGLAWGAVGRAGLPHARGLQAQLLRLPVLGPTLEKLGVARMLLALSILLEAGCPLADSSVVANLGGNLELEERYLSFLEGLKAGLGVGEALDASGCFPSLARRMLRVGEEHGRMVAMVRRVADMYVEDVAMATDTLATLLEPLALLSMGVIVGVVVLATFLPILSVIQQL